MATPSAYKHVRKLLVGLGNPGKKFDGTRHNIGNAVVSHFLETYAQQVLGTSLSFRHESNCHGDLCKFSLPFQHSIDPGDRTSPIDDLISKSSTRRRAKTIEEGVPHAQVNVALLLPTTYMNRSGVAVRSFMHTHQWRLKRNPLSLSTSSDELLVIADDVALPFGTCRFKPKGGAGGQNGLKDVIKSAGTERFGRLKIGVGAPEWFTGGTGAPPGTAMDKFVLSRFNADEQDQLPKLLEYTNELLRLYLHRGLSQAATVSNSMQLEDFRKIAV